MIGLSSNPTTNPVPIPTGLPSRLSTETPFSDGSSPVLPPNAFGSLVPTVASNTSSSEAKEGLGMVLAFFASIGVVFLVGTLLTFHIYNLKRNLVAHQLANKKLSTMTTVRYRFDDTVSL